MIGHTGLLEYHPCPIGSLCTRVYCPFMHEQVSQNQHPSTSTSNRGLVISQEDNNFQGGGYVGYVGSVNGYSASAMPTTSYNQPVYAQELSISNSSYNQQLNYQQPAVGGQYGQWQPTNQYGAYHQSIDQLYGNSALQPQVSLYAPEGPAISTSTSAGVPVTISNPVYSQVLASGKTGQSSFSSSHRQQQPSPNIVPFTSNASSAPRPKEIVGEDKFQPRVREQFSPLADAVSSNVPRSKEAVGKEKFQPRVREQFSPLADAVAINPKGVKSHLVKKKGFEAVSAEKQNVIKSQKRKITEQVQEYQKKLDRQTPDFEEVERAEKQAIDDILSTASHVCVPLSSEPVPKKKLPSKSRPAATVKKSVSNEMPTARTNVPAKEVVRKQISANDAHQSRKDKEEFKFVVETKAAPASALAHRAKQHENLRHSDSSSRESSVEFVSTPNNVTIDLTSDGEMRGNSQTKVKTSVGQLEFSKQKVNSTKIKGKPDVLNANIKAITKIDEEIEKIGRDLLSKKTPVWRQEESARDTVKKWNIADSKPKNLPTPSSGALHNPNFDINSLFDDDDLVDSSKNSKESGAISGSVQGPSRKNSSSSAVIQKPQNSVKSRSTSIGAQKKIPSATEALRNRFASSASSSCVGANPEKVYKMFNKGGLRTARPAPSLAPGKALAPLDPHNKKVSYGVRFKYLQKLRDEIHAAEGCSEDEAVEKAIKQEKCILDRVSSKIGYGGAIATAIKQIRETKAGPATTHGSEGISHNDVLAGRHGNNISIAIKRSKRDEKSHISEADFYLALRDRYLMSKEQLYENGYPIWVDDLTKRLVAIKPSEGRRQRCVADENLKRVCSRCGFEYRLTKDGLYASEVDAECIFHFGKAWKKRYNGTVDTRYTCCEQDLSIKGCTVMERHITDTIRQSTLHQYVETPRPVGPGDPRSNKVYALDCEMVYGVWGTQLARISVVDLLDELVLDEIVRPEENNPIVDCNTRFSGLTKEQIDTAKYDLQGVQKKLFELVNNETILIGHSLESDLKALRIVHLKVVDTSVVFPHRLGPPKKRALKTLTSEILQKIIQEEEGGHDSKEDASACMKLMYHKVKSDGVA